MNEIEQLKAENAALVAQVAEARSLYDQHHEMLMKMHDQHHEMLMKLYDRTKAKVKAEDERDDLAARVDRAEKILQSSLPFKPRIKQALECLRRQAEGKPQ